ncbi:MAG: methyltransferase [Desulfocurvibacter africanus]
MDKPQSDFGPIETIMMQEVAFTAILESVRIGIFDDLGAQPLSAKQLAEKHGFLEPATESLLDVLTANGLLRKESEGYRNTQLASDYFVSTSPFFQGKALEIRHQFNASIKDGFIGLLRGTAGAREITDSVWSTEDTMQGTEQHARMGGLQDTVAFIAGLPGFQTMRMMCDIGGNHGAFSMALLDRNPDLHGVIADLPEVASAANDRIARLGYSSRLEAIGCDLRSNRLPAEQYDLVLASHILYAFVNDLDGIIRMIHESLRSGGWFVAHHVNPDGELPKLVVSGLEFTTRMLGYPTHLIGRTQFEDSLRKAGFNTIQFDTVGKDRGGLIVAARKS